MKNILAKLKDSGRILHKAAQMKKRQDLNKLGDEQLTNLDAVLLDNKTK